jgi:UDP-N-acetylmuramyl tripeptide synthase
MEKRGAPPIPNRLAKAVIIVMTGRGHENYLEMPGGKIYFEEREVIRQHLLEMEK